MKRLLPVLLLATLSLFGQTVSPIVQPHQQFFGLDGKPLSGGMIWTYAAGTTTQQATYSDSSGTVPNTNPIILDVSGSADIWLLPTGYKFIAQDADGNLLWTVDNVQGLGVPTIPANSGDDFGSTTKRWNGYFTNIDASGTLHVSGDSTFDGLITADRVAGKSFNGDTYLSKYASLNAAVAATAAGHVVYVDTDTTLLSTVTIPSGVAIICRPGTTITKGMNSDAIAMSSDSVLYGCKIDGNGGSFATGKNVIISGITKALVAKNELVNSAEQGIYSLGSTDVQIVGNKVSGSLANGIQITNGGSNVVISQNIVNCAGGVVNQSDCIIVVAEATPSAGNGPSDIAITGNVLAAGATDFCVEIGNFAGLSDPNNIAVSGNTCKLVADAANGGFSVSIADVVSISGNSFYSNGHTSGVAAFECAGCTQVDFTANVAEVKGTGFLISQNDLDIGILNNVIRTDSSTITDWCVNVENAVVSDAIARVGIKGNKCMVLTAGSNGIQVQCNATGTTCSDISITGNDVVGNSNASGIGIQLDQATGTLTRAQLQNNNVANWLVGFNFNAAANVAFIGNYANNVGGLLGGGVPGTGFKGDDVNGFTFSQLGSFSNGSRLYCSNCTIASPCAGAGTGAIAKRLAGVWVCN
jgi:hypothetical protein